MMAASAHPGCAAHIAIVMHDFSTGGSERVAIRLANEWARRGRKVTILCGTIDGPVRCLISPDVTIVTMWPEIRRSLLSRLMLGFAFADCIGTLQPNIVFAPGNFHIPVIVALAARLGQDRPALACKLSNPVHMPESGPIRPAVSFVMRRLGCMIDAFVAMSGSLRDEAADALKMSTIRVISEPTIDAGGPTQSGERNRDPDQPALIVCAGRLVAQKNFMLAIRAFARLLPIVNARLLILGEGDQRGRLEMEAGRLGLVGHVRFAGHVADIRPDLGKASLLLLSSRYEGYPAVLIEALAAGVPVVTTDCSPAIAEILAHPSFGRIVAADAKQMADAIGDVLRAGPPDPTSVTRLLVRHRIDNVAEDYLALFDDTVAIRRQRTTKSPPVDAGLASGILISNRA